MDMIQPPIAQASSKKELIKQLDYAVALAREIKRQADVIARIVQEGNRIPLAA